METATGIFLPAAFLLRPALNTGCVDQPFENIPTASLGGSPFHWGPQLLRCQDALMVVYLSNLTRTQISIAESGRLLSGCVEGTVTKMPTSSLLAGYDAV